ncbi:MAG TPA: LTA synthase family protein [Thermoanaerobaculia bacterium]|nr:LTA synthase family protein [Thermoanaerobaculia bacterium]HQR66040.1 LTA synthase family protein [Thermoanaerobaculia bacterium]
MTIRSGHRALAVAVALLGTIVLCTVIALPRSDSALERLTPTTLLLNGLPVAYFFLAFLLIVRRSLSATALTVVVCLAITLGNNFKYSIVSQPVVASDFILFGQVLANPVLFEKYFREQWMFIPLLLVVVAVPLWAIRLERPLLTDRRWTAVSVAAGLLLLWQIQPLMLMPRAPLQRVYRALLPPFDNHDPMSSVKRYGLMATLVNSAGQSYFVPPVIEAGDLALINQLAASMGPPAKPVGALPNLVVIESEAFFDFRVLDPAFSPSAYALWDRLKATSRYGMATVDTYGGATLRTEFSLLTGVPATLFGAEMDYPYLTVVTAPIAAVPWHLKALGYETTAIHPFHDTFWRRNKAYPRLGFDTFLSLTDFQGAAHDGPYVSDEAVCQKIRGLLREGDKPRFIFAVTMENHGPWSFDRDEKGDLEPALTRDLHLPEQVDLQLQRYLYHARNAAAMAGCVIEGLEEAGRPGVLLFLGDHAPAMPAVFAAFGVSNPWKDPALRKTPYLLWRSGANGTGPVDTAVSALPAALLEAAGLPLDEFLSVSRFLRQNCLQPAAAGARPGGDVPCPSSPEAAMLALARQRLRPLGKGEGPAR